MLERAVLSPAFSHSLSGQNQRWNMTKLYEARNHILICTGYADPEAHRHMAAHIILSPEKQIKVVLEDTMYLCHGIVIPSGCYHKVETDGAPVMVFLYDSTTNVAKRLSKVQILSEADCSSIAAIFRHWEAGRTAEGYASFESAVLHLLGIRESVCSVTDERITAAMAHIHARMSEPVTCQEIADSVFLSQSRFSHLFKEQTGMTFAAYLICKRLLYVYREILRGCSITEAALAAGFSSSGHFADVNHRVFGLSASSITRDLCFMKIQ